MAERTQISIVGLGCVGTSIGLALHQAESPLYSVGHDKESDRAGAARKLQAVDKTDWNLIGACAEADIVVLALPMNAIQDTMRALASHLKPGCVVTDTASLKEQVVHWAKDTLPDSVSFVGGNPVVVSSGVGPDAADADLFRDRLYCITPAPNAQPDAVSLISDLVSLLGGQPYYLDPAEHDGLMAGVDHLPQALAVALVNGITRESAWREMRKLAGGGFERMSALVAEDPDAQGSLLLANRENLLRWLDAYLDALKEVRGLVAQGEHESLAQHIDQAVVARRQWLQDRRQRFSEIKPVELERGGFMRQLFLGPKRRRS